MGTQRMKKLQLIAFAILMTAGNSSHALSDFYYSQGLDIDFAIADEELSVKRSLEGILNRLLSLVNHSVTEDDIGIDLNYFTDMNREFEE